MDVSAKIKSRMPAPKEVTFVGWLEDILKAPLEIPRQTIAIVKAPYTKELLALRVTAFGPFHTMGEGDYISALAVGPEAVADLKGVRTSVSVVDLARSPNKVIKGVLQGTISQIFDLDEISQNRREDQINRLVRGQTKDAEGKPLGRPGGLPLKVSSALRITPFSKQSLIKEEADGTRKSRIQLVEDDKDIRTIALSGNNSPLDDEEKRSLARSQYQTYLNLGDSLIQLADGLEDKSMRLVSRDAALINYNRGVIQELGYDLDKILDTKGRLNQTPEDGMIKSSNKVKGTLHNELLASKVEDIVSSDASMAQIFQLPVGGFQALNPHEQHLLRRFVRQEDIAIKKSYWNPIAQLEHSEALLDKIKAAKLDTILYSKKYESHWTRSAFIGDITQAQSRTALEMQQYASVHAKDIHSIVFERNDRLHRANPNVDVQSLNAKTLERMKTAELAADVANELFGAATFKEILEHVEEGSFIRAALVSSKYLNAIGIKSISDFTDVLKLKRFTNATVKNGKLVYQYRFGKMARNIYDAPEKTGMFLGLTKGGSPYQKKKPPPGIMRLRPSLFENFEIVDWEVAPGVKRSTKVMAKNMGGISPTKPGRNSMLDLLGSFDTLGVGETDSRFNPNRLLSITNANGEYTELKTLVEDIQKSCELFEEGTRLTPEMETVITELDLLEKIPDKQIFKNGKAVLDSNGNPTFTLIKRYETLTDEFETFNDGIGSELVRLSSAKRFHGKGLPPDQRWKFIKKITKNGKLSNLTSTYMGIIDMWNKYANAARNYLYQNVILGNVITRIPILGRAFKPIQKIVRGLGFDEEATLSSVIKKSRFTKGLWGKTDYLGKVASGPEAQIGTRFTNFVARKLGFVGGGAGKGIATLLNRLGPTLFKVLGATAGVAASALTGGIAWAVTSLGQTAWAFSKNLLTLNFAKGIAEAKAVLVSKFGVIKKVVIYPIFGCCVALPLMVVVMIIPSVLAPFGIGGGSIEDAISTMITVSKTATKGANSITFEIKIKNIGNQPVTIDEIIDSLSFTPACNTSGTAITSVYDPTDPGSFPAAAGTVSGFPRSNKGTEIQPGDTFKIPTDLKVTNIPGAATLDMTFYNVVQVTIKEDPGKIGIDDELVKFNDGGCPRKCPAGWPLDPPFYITQGPYESAPPGTSHADEKSEAIDMSYPGITGKPIYTTHGGIAVVGKDAAANGGYGYYVYVKSKNSSDQDIVSIYAHMNSQNVINGASVIPGQVIGYVGDSGNSQGAHLHYGFQKPLHECIQNEDLRMVNVHAAGYPGAYIPITVKRDCYGQADCNLTVN